MFGHPTYTHILIYTLLKSRIVIHDELLVSFSSKVIFTAAKKKLIKNESISVINREVPVITLTTLV